MPWGLEGVYYLSVCLFQALLAYLIWRAGRRRTVNTAFGIVLGLSALQTLNLLTSGLGVFNLHAGPRKFVDTAILGTLAYLLAQFPRPLGGRRGARASKRLWIGVLAAWGVTSQLLVAAVGVDHPLYKLPRQLLHEGAFALIAGLFVLHFVPRWVETEPGPLRTQALFAGVGLAATVFDQGVRWIVRLVVEPSKFWTGGLSGALHDLAAWLVLAGIARVAYAALRSRDREHWLLGGLVLAAVGLGVHSRLRTTVGALEFAAHVFRPVLFGIAMLRFELVDVPEAERRWAVPAGSIALGAITFLMLVGILTPGSIDAQQIEPVSALAAVVVLGGLAWLARPVSRAIDPDTDARRRGQVLERYRLAIERARQRGDGMDLSTLRNELGVTGREHELMVSLVENRALVRTEHLTPAEPGDVVGRYEVERELGRGGAGRALSAWDRVSDRRVVLKEVLRPWEEDADRRRRALEREARAARGLDHPSLAGVVDLVDANGRLYLVREYVPGSTLDDVVGGEGPLSVDRTRRVGLRLSRALSVLHDRGLLHLDLKPSNVVLAEGDRPVLIDHGTVQTRSNGNDGGAGGVTATQTLAGDSTQVGTLGWMAPEQVLEEPVDERSDVFALGALLYYLATGRTHVELEERSRFAVEDDLVHGSPPSDVPPGLSEVVGRALARDPDRRWSSIGEVAERLAAHDGSALPSEDEQA